MVACLNNLTIETAGMEEEAEEGMAVALEMEVEGGRSSEGEEGGGETRWALESLEFLTQEAEPSGTTLIDACNRFNELSHLAMLGTVRHRWLLSLLFCLTFRLYSSSQHSLYPPLSYGMGRPLYAGLEACAQLEVTARRLFLFPHRSHYEFDEGPAERLPYAHRAHPVPFI